MAKKVTARQAREAVNRFADKVSAADVSSTVGNESKFKLLFQSVDILARYWDEIKVVFAMLRDYATGRYKKCPWRTIAVLVGALGYVLTPLDLIPDFIPLIGWTDDCLAIAGALAFAKTDIEEYKASKFSRKTGRTKLLER